MDYGDVNEPPLSRTDLIMAKSILSGYSQRFVCSSSVTEYYVCLGREQFFFRERKMIELTKGYLVFPPRPSPYQITVCTKGYQGSLPEWIASFFLDSLSTCKFDNITMLTLRIDIPISGTNFQPRDIIAFFTSFSSVTELQLGPGEKEIIPFFLHIFKSHQPVVFPSLHTVKSCMGGWDVPTEEQVLEFLRWRIAIKHPIGILRLLIGDDPVTWENFTALQEVSGLLVIFNKVMPCM
jgi:hypothetical protein